MLPGDSGDLCRLGLGENESNTLWGGVAQFRKGLQEGDSS